VAAGFAVEREAPGSFGEPTQLALRAFQSANGLEDHGECDASTWSALVEAQFRPGDRLLCLRSPMMRGDDVADLQLRLGALGFDAGRVDGILGPVTQTAIGEFQRNAGLVTDQVCGPETVEALVRLEGRGGNSPVTAVRELEHLRRSFASLAQVHVALGMEEGLHPLLAGLAASLQAAGTKVNVVDGDWSAQAIQSNKNGADVYLGLILSDDPVIEARYFSTPGFESRGGRRLAELIVTELPATPGWSIGTVRGMRMPILRETRAPAVVVKLGSTRPLDEDQGLIVASLHRALERWPDDPE